MVQISRVGVVCSGSADDVERQRLRFERCHVIRWPGLLKPDLLTLIQCQIDKAEFQERLHLGIGQELCMAHNATRSLLHFLINDPKLFRLVQHITRCRPIGCFTGRVYRMMPGSGHYDSWHADTEEHRVIAMSINLSHGLYEGGLLQLRESRSKKILSEAANCGPGDAILFRIAHQLEHRVTGLEGTLPKTAFAGWFRSEPGFRAVLGLGPVGHQ
jgi:hypothetical protein